MISDMDDQMHVDLDRDASIAALETKLANSRAKKKRLQTKIDMMVVKLHELKQGDEHDNHEITTAVVTLVDNNHDLDVNDNESVSVKGHKPKRAYLQTKDFHVGLTERKANAMVLLYYYDVGDKVKKFVGMAKLRKQTNFFCAHCKITARLMKGKNTLELLNAHKDGCEGEDRSRFIREQRRRRNNYDESKDENYLLCNKYVSCEQMHDQHVM